jgi:hypothetical protein
MAARRPVVRLNGSFQQLPPGDWLPVSAGGTGATDAPTALGNLGGQPLHANLTALAGLIGSASKQFYFTGAGAMALADLTVFGRQMNAAADQAGGRSVLGLGGAATYGVTSGATGQADFLLWRTNDLVKQTTTFDTNAGRVLVMGSGNQGPFGLGQGANYTDANALTHMAFYRNVSLAASNAPTPYQQYILNLPHVADTSTTAGQIALQYTSAGGGYLADPHLFIRSKTGATTWGNWYELLRTGDYGLGGTAIVALETNLNDNDRGTGFYNFTAQSLGILPLNINGYGYHFDNASAGFAFQEYVPVTLNRKFFRRQASGTWGGWSEYAFLGSAQTWTAKQTFNDYTQLGDTAPAIKMKKLTGTTAAAEGGSASVNHGVTSSKVIGVQVLVFHSSTNAILPGWVASAGYQYDVQLTSTGVQVVLHATNSENILSKAFTVLITYEE